MATLAEIYPHIFTKSRLLTKSFLQWFANNPDFVQLSISLFRPLQCKSFSKITLSAKAQNINLQSKMCECLTPLNFFAHALYTLSEGHYTDDLNEALEKLRKYIEEGVKDMWHGRPDIIIKHGKVQQAVTVKQGTSVDSGEPAVKKARIDAGDTDQNCHMRTGLVEVKKEFSWSVMGIKEQDQEPIPQLLS